MKVFILVALLGCYAVSAEYKKCSDLPKIKFDAVKFCQPYIFNVYKSNDITEKCAQFYFFGGRNGDPNKATVLLQFEDDAKSMPFSVTESVDKLHCMVVSEDNKTLSYDYYKLIVNEKEHYFCKYACDTEGEFITSIKCLALDKAGLKKIDKELQQFPNLPYKKDAQKLVDVYKCESDPRPGGYRLASGSADTTTCGFNIMDIFKWIVGK